MNRIQEHRVLRLEPWRGQNSAKVLLSKHTEDSAGTGDNSPLNQKIEICISEWKWVEYNGESKVLKHGIFYVLWSKFFRFANQTSVQFSISVVSDSLRPHELQHTRPPCPSPTPGVHSDSRPESVIPSSHLILCRPLLLLPPIPPSNQI